MEGLIEGRIVHFVTETGKHRPAVVVQVWNKETGCCNLQVLLDGTNDARDNFTREQMDRGMAWVTSVVHDDNENLKPPRTWHFPERD